jgi:hypothetical protein
MSELSKGFKNIISYKFGIDGLDGQTSVLSKFIQIRIVLTAIGRSRILRL